MYRSETIKVIFSKIPFFEPNPTFSSHHATLTTRYFSRTQQSRYTMFPTRSNNLREFSQTNEPLTLTIKTRNNPNRGGYRTAMLRREIRWAGEGGRKLRKADTIITPGNGDLIREKKADYHKVVSLSVDLMS